MERQPVLEVIAVNVEDARVAEEGGADRIELVSAMSEGGLTPVMVSWSMWCPRYPFRCMS